VIGEYVPSVVIGKFTKEKAKKLHVKFEPTKYGYAGIENPVGKKFEGIIRFVTPVYKNSKLLGYLTLALDHHHIMDFTDYINPTSPQKYDISDASSGNYAFMWSNDFECISHPRDYFIIGYDKNGKKVPGWIDAELEKKYEASKYKDLNQFLKTQPIFFNQSLKKKPNLKQLKIGQVGLDCKYLNFAPQCQGWSELVNDGGYGSFIIYWSKVWKLTVAASIPYYTGDYGNSKIGFGFITIGANVEDFHKAATDTKKKIETILQNEFKKLEKNIKAISQELYKKIKQQIQHLTIITFILIVIVVYVAIILSNYITNKIKSIIIGTQKLKERNFEYKIKYNSKDEFGELIKSFNEMASSINNLKKDLENKIYTDELTKLKNRVALLKKLEQTKDATIILIDIDGFKNINDFYGGEAGNFILKKFATLLQKFATKHSFIPYRIGSDDYALYTNEILTPSEIKKVITTLKDYIKSNKISSEYYNFDISFSFTSGVAFGKDNLIEKADLALNKAKKLRTLFVIYDVNDTSMNKHSEFIMWKEKITYAIKHDNIVPYFQPIVSVKNKDEKKYEVLMRLIDNGTPISPIFFLDIAKETRQYTELTKIILDKAFKKLLTTDAVFSINLSMIDITDKETVEYIYTNIKKYNIGNQIVFEILETENITDFDTILEFIKQVKALGVKIAIDDFGSGYSNFAYFSMMKPDFLKIDGSLIKNIKRGSTEYLIVEAIVKFAKSLNIMLVAEFVSNKEIYQTLLDFDIDYMQGYYFSEPKENL
jgi:diguanylate cyclase (GGDEF)-like protein